MVSDYSKLGQAFEWSRLRMLPFREERVRNLKTYLGQGEEELYLADWTTLHLDVLAGERGLVRRGATLYEL